MTEAVTRPPMKIHVDEYDKMADLGVFGPRGPRMELIGGQLYEMAPIGTAHLVLVTRLAQQLANINGQGRLLVQQPIRVSEFDEPQPDLAVLHEPLGMQKPEARECLLVIEVSDSTYRFDRDVKGRRYLEAGAEWGWIVNVAAAAIEFFCEPADFDDRDFEVAYAEDGGISRLGDAEIDVTALFDGFDYSPRARAELEAKKL